MRSLFRLLASLGLSGVFLMALSAAGVVRFNPEGQLEPAAMGARIQEGLSAALEKTQVAEYLAEVNGELTAESGQPGQPRSDPDEQPEAVRPPIRESLDTDPGMDAALAVLTTWGEQPRDANPEKYLRDRLRSLGVSSERIDRIVRMSFWKGFVTLQDEPEDGTGASNAAHKQAFEQELALKQAGFAALGLRTGDQLVAEARRLQQVATPGGEQR